MAPIPDMTNNTQNTIIHVLILLCSLFMISSCSAGPAVDNSWKRASGRLGHFPARLRGDHNDTSMERGQPWKNGGLWVNFRDPTRTNRTTTKGAKYHEGILLSFVDLRDLRE